MEPIQQVITRNTLQQALRQLGVKSGMTLEVHASLSSLGYMIGGASAVVDALLETAGKDGTVMMPMQNAENKDPSAWSDPPLEPSLWQTVRDNTPPYHPEQTDLSSVMGAVAENFRHRNGVIFSGHPSLGFAAIGRYARLLCNRQSMHFPLAEESPTARLYELRGSVLLIGTDYRTCTCMHLAEYRTECRPVCVKCAAITQNGEPVWKRYLDLDLDASSFNQIGALMEKAGAVKSLDLGPCRLRLFSAVDAVDTAAGFLERNSVYELYR